MPSMSGSFTGSTSAQASIAVKDQAGHELNLAQIVGLHKSSDPKWDGARITYWGVADLTGGNGSQHGYFLNEHPNGDTSRGTFECKVTTAAGVVTLDGTWQFSGGTAGLSGLGGNGTFKGRLTSPTEVETSWEGNYQLG